MSEEKIIPFSWPEIERWHDELPRMTIQCQDYMGLPEWKQRIFGGAMLLAFGKTVDIALTERADNTRLRSLLIETLAMLRPFAVIADGFDPSDDPDAVWIDKERTKHDISGLKLRDFQMAADVADKIEAEIEEAK